MPPFLAPLLKAGATALGSVLGFAGQREANQAQSQAVAATNARTKAEFYKGLKFNRNEARKSRLFNKKEAMVARGWSADQAAIDRKLQRQFAKKSAGWQFKDLMDAADESGIHRLSALGAAGGASYSPVGLAMGGASDGGGAGAPSAPYYSTPDAAIGGSIVGDGMNAVADFFSEQQAAEEERIGVAKEDARRDALLASEVERNSAEAEMYRSRARTELFNAQTNRGALAAAANFGDPDSTRPVTMPKRTLSGENVGLPAGNDIDETLMGIVQEVLGVSQAAGKFMNRRTKALGRNAGADKGRTTIDHSNTRRWSN